MKKHEARERVLLKTGRSSDRGSALIMVLLCMLILSVLAAGIVFTARSETFASVNYKLSTQADYLAKAGIQQAVNWLRSGRYQAVTASQASTYYLVSDDGTGNCTLDVPCTANTQPVQMKSNSNAVQLIGYGSGSSNYPAINDADGTAVTTAFQNDLVNVRVTGDSNNSGTFSVNATLLNYQTVNTGTVTAISNSVMETWLITSRGTWTGTSGSSTTIASAVEQAIVQPVYVPNWADALYGLCGVWMHGSAGVCTDSFNSALGQYAGGNISVAAGHCDSSSANVIASGAGVGSNGGVTLSSNVTVSGNVTIGSGPPSGCGYNGFSGNASSVLGQVVTGPHENLPPAPTFRSGFPTGAPSYSAAQLLPVSSKLAWPAMPPFPGTFASPASNTPPVTDSNGNVVHTPCIDTTCDGTEAHPYEISGVSLSGNGDTLQLIGSPDIVHPVYYDIDSVSVSGKGEIDVSGAVVLNVRTSFSVTGNGITNGIGGTADIPPAMVAINFAGASMSLGGNGAISAIVNAPKAYVTLGGGGSKGYLVGSIRAATIEDGGGYPVHYDIQLDRLGGTVSVPTLCAYSRQKM